MAGRPRHCQAGRQYNVSYKISHHTTTIQHRYSHTPSIEHKRTANIQYDHTDTSLAQVYLFSSQLMHWKDFCSRVNYRSKAPSSGITRFMMSRDTTNDESDHPKSLQNIQYPANQAIAGQHKVISILYLLPSGWLAEDSLVLWINHIIRHHPILSIWRVPI